VRVLLTLVAYVTSLILIAGVSFVVVIFLAGPHAGLLPHWLEVVVLILGWLAILVVPVLAAAKVWRRLGATPPDISSDRTREK
jgi:hypothetical protein